MLDRAEAGDGREEADEVGGAKVDVVAIKEALDEVVIRVEDFHPLDSRRSPILLRAQVNSTLVCHEDHRSK